MGEGGRVRLRAESCRAGRVADGVVPAAEQHEIEQFVLGELGAQLFPQRFGQVTGAMEFVDRTDQQPVAEVGPTSVIRLTMGEGRDLGAVQVRTRGEEHDVHTPLVLQPVRA